MSDTTSKKKDAAAAAGGGASSAIKLSSAAVALQDVAKPIVDTLTWVLPLVIAQFFKLQEQFNKLPQNMINFFIGFVFCFSGGLYPVLFAAIEAAEFGGRQTVMAAIKDLANEAMIIIEESKKDDTIDEDKDGKADVTEVSGQEYVMRKTLLVLKKMNPNKIDTAISNMYRVWLSVAAVLTIEFARAISMALAISDFMKKPVNRFIAPTIQLAVPNEYDKWVPVILGWICKSIGMSIAWYIQSVRSAFASALVGGLMMSRAAFFALTHRGITLGGFIPEDHTKSNFDEYLSYVFAALGFYWQYSVGFDMPFPLNLVFWPFELAEYYIRWTVTS